MDSNTRHDDHHENERQRLLLGLFAIDLRNQLSGSVTDDVVEHLFQECDGDVKRALELHAKMFQGEHIGEVEAPESEQSDVDDEKSHKQREASKDDAGPTEKVVYRDQYWDKAERRHRLVQVKGPQKSSTDYGRYVLFVRRLYSEKMIFERTEVEVNGPNLRRILKNIFADARGFPLTDSKDKIDPKWLFWAKNHLEDLQRHLEAETTDAAAFEVAVALEFISSEYPKKVLLTKDIRNSTGVEFSDLWAVFPPNCLIYGQDILEQDRVWRVLTADFRQQSDKTWAFEIQTEYLELDGQRIGTADGQLKIPGYNGAITISDLPYEPLYLREDRVKIWTQALERTEKQLSFFAISYSVQEHSGEGMTTALRQRSDFWDPAIQYFESMVKRMGEKLPKPQPSRQHFQGRVVIDPVLYRSAEQSPLIPDLRRIRRLGASACCKDTPDGRSRNVLDFLRFDVTVPAEKEDQHNLSDAGDSESEQQQSPDFPERGISRQDTGFANKTNKQVLDDLCDYEKILFSGLVFGFSLTERQWGAFSVSHLREVQWNHDIFKSLVMEENLKHLMFRLVEAHGKRVEFDDFVPGKGKGLVGLLCGPPGLGKTFTAEAIAETADAPLYTVSSGELGADATTISVSLSKILQLTKRWKAVLLLDEADVFLAQRRDTDLARNAIVSVFLREMEHYPGILILTTNQAQIIDSAFQSRIHFVHHYQSLDRSARRRIWNNFVQKTKETTKLKIEIAEDGLDRLSSADFNGRQIKNAFSVAVTLALDSEHKTLSTDDIINAGKSLQNFDFNQVFGNEAISPALEKVIEAGRTLQNFDFNQTFGDGLASHRPRRTGSDLIKF